MSNLKTANFNKLNKSALKADMSITCRSDQ